MKKLFITEKPSVAMEFAKILGVNKRNDGYMENDNYVITWCVGHLVCLAYPDKYDIKYKKWDIKDIPFLPDKYIYEIIPSVKKQYDIIKKFLNSKEIDTVYWAGDSAREGQVIEENIRILAGVRKGMKELRIWIDSQTEEEILRGIKTAKPMSEYDNLAKAGLMRAIEDYAVGINFSRALTCKYGDRINASSKKKVPISVGRVMTCVLGMVVSREIEIKEFEPEKFYKVKANCNGIVFEWKYQDNSVIKETVKRYNKNSFLDKSDAEKLISKLKGKKAIIENVEIKNTKKAAPLLFNLAELQNEATKILKISPDETLEYVQRLYEKKLVTYPRTDARVLSTAVSKEISNNICGLAKVPKYKDIIDDDLIKISSKIIDTKYVDDSKISDHYAIIPTGRIAEDLSEIEKSIFYMIVNRFLSIFMEPAVYSNTDISFKIENEVFNVSSKVLTNLGYLKLYDAESKENREVSEFVKHCKEGSQYSVTLSIAEGMTSPPKRYTSGSMILAMENAGQLIEEEELREQIKGSGIGTSATRAEIVKKLVEIGYLMCDKKTQILMPTMLGFNIYNIVAKTVPSLLKPKMTASWEKGLKSIEDGTVTTEVYQRKLYDYIRKEVENIKNGNISV